MWNPMTEVEKATNRRVIKIMLVALGATLLGMASPKIAFAQGGPTVVDTPMAMVIPSPCIAGEFISLNGRVTMAMYTRMNGTTTHFTFRIITKMQGTTVDPLNPKKYVLNDEDVQELNQGGATEATNEINQVLIRQSEAPGDINLGGFGDDFKSKTKVHFTFNALGTPTASVNDITFSCM
jgi:hypothetical protein